MADVAFLWHMHQPDYRHPLTRQFTRPWVLLHAIKDYTDMASHLEDHPGVRCTINWVPVLLDQIQDYSEQLRLGAWRDALLRILGNTTAQALDAADRAWLLDVAFRCHAPTMVEPFAPFRHLRDLAQLTQSHNGGDACYLADDYFFDLAVWCVLAWSGETLRRKGTHIPALMAKGWGFTPADRQDLLQELGSTVQALIPRYRALAERGQIELSCSPANHPLAPLLLDFEAARESEPHSPLPSASAYPGGRSRVEAQIRAAQISHEAHFGQPPMGMWPPEGAVSTAFVRQIASAGFQWTASSQGVLRQSAGPQAQATTSWQAPEGVPADTTLFFRNDRLSDLIGFEYAKWHGRDAAAHFMQEVQALHRQDPRNLVPVFLDGENAWEHYPYNAWYFFDDLYESLERSADIRTCTLSQACQTHHDRRENLPRLVAGSWVYGTLSTWIGSPEKNRAWDMLCELKQSVDRALDHERLSPQQRAQVLELLTVCEGSDWFWWLGEDNPADSTAYFDQMFRENIRAIYHLLNLPAPANLDHPIGPRAAPAQGGGTMRRSTA